MSQRAQRSFCLLAVFGMLWTVAVLWFPISRWQLTATQMEVRRTQISIQSAHAKANGWGELICGWDYPFRGHRDLPPENWKELSIAILTPGVAAILTGLVGTSAGLLLGGSSNAFRLSKGTHGRHA